jgi:hypothetical protein
MYGLGLLNVAEPPTKPELTPRQAPAQSGIEARVD